MEPDRRIYPCELREVQAVGRPYKYLEGRAVPYDTWQDVGPFMESHAARSFERSTKSNAGQNLPLIIGHDPHDLDNLVGHAERWNHDLSGMYGVWKLNGSARAQQAASLAESGDLTGLSVGFQEVHADPPFRKNGRAWIRRTESRLMEVSLTPVPAFPDAGVINVRSHFDPDSLEDEPIPTPERDRWLARVAELRPR